MIIVAIVPSHSVAVIEDRRHFKVLIVTLLHISAGRLGDGFLLLQMVMSWDSA